MVELALRADTLTKQYPGRRGQPPVQALRGVSIEVAAGSTYGIVGESGCGKSTLARLLVGLESPSSGAIEVGGVTLDLGNPADRLARARRIQLVFQDPFSSLDPRMRVERALTEVLAVHGLHPERRQARVAELLDMVALGQRFADRYPHELSGGQAQRVAIARALAAEPGVLVLDEPTSALDVSVRAEIMNLLVRIQDELGLSYVFISHDISMVRHLSDEIAVMYLGKVVESGPYDRVLDASLHPYTRALALAVPVPDPEIEASRIGTRPVTASEVSSDIEQGCPYAPRCVLVEPHCREVAPELVSAGEMESGRESGRGEHQVACHVALRTVRSSS